MVKFNLNKVRNFILYKFYKNLNILKLGFILFYVLIFGFW